MSLLGIIASSKVGANYYSQIQTDGAITAYKLEETTGTSLTDYIGARTATLAGGFTLNQTGPGAVVDKAILFNGSTGYADTASSSAFNVASSSNWAVEVWFKRNNNTALECMYIVRDNLLAILVILGDGQVAMGMTNSSGGELNIFSSTIGFDDNNWHHLVGTAESGGSAYLYVDGVEEATTSTARLTTTSNRAINLARNPNTGDYFGGLLAAPAFYTSYLSSTEVLDHYNKGI